MWLRWPRIWWVVGRNWLIIMTTPTDTLARIDWPVKRRCRSCSRVFFAFSELRETCFPQCGSNGKRREDVAPVEPCCNSGCSRCRVKHGRTV
jgi:hypothetical protein